MSYEATQYEQGLLTYALLQGMRGAALREQEYIDVSRLFQYAADTVPNLASHVGGIQRPRIAAPKGTSFDIGQLRAADRRQIFLAEAKPVLLPPPEIQNSDVFWDSLELTARIRKRLREISYAALRGAQSRLPIVYVDADEVTGAIRPSGSYRIQGARITTNIVLVKDGHKVAGFRLARHCGECRNNSPELDDVVQELVDGLLKAAKDVD